LKGAGLRLERRTLDHMSPENKELQRLAVYTGLISAIAVMLVVPVYLGHLLDEYWGTDPWMMLVGLFVGCIATFFELFWLLKRDRD
jgi:F0F1-type ATP synthase assembly protein I